MSTKATGSAEGNMISAITILLSIPMADKDNVGEVNSAGFPIRSKEPNNYTVLATHNVMIPLPLINEYAKIVVTPSRYRLKNGSIFREFPDSERFLDIVLIYQGYALPLAVGNEWAGVDIAMINAVKAWNLKMENERAFVKTLCDIISKSVAE